MIMVMSMIMNADCDVDDDYQDGSDPYECYCLSCWHSCCDGMGSVSLRA